jgi:ribosome-associated protein
MLESGLQASEGARHRSVPGIAAGRRVDARPGPDGHPPKPPRCPLPSPSRSEPGAGDRDDRSAPRHLSLLRAAAACKAGPFATGSRAASSGQPALAPEPRRCEAGVTFHAVAAMQHIEFELDRDHVELNQLLKLAGLCDSGGAGKAIVASGAVSVDGAVELRKTCKIHAGQVVSTGDARIHVVAAR